MTLALEAAHDASTHDRGCTEVGRRPLVTMDEQESGAHSPAELVKPRETPGRGDY